MEHLRWILLGAGILFVIAVYLFSRKRQRNRDDFSETCTDSELDISAVDLDAVDEGVGEVRVVARDDDIDMHSEEQLAMAAVEKQQIPEIITVYILTHSAEQRFKGDKINSAARSCGMVFGNMNIFHKLDDNDQPLFSLANMMEPGSFDPGTLFEMETTGLALFMQLDMVSDADAALDDMLSTAYHISEMIGGQLCNHKRRAISQQDTDQYRELTANY